jgi:hypothetical protein
LGWLLSSLLKPQVLAYLYTCILAYIADFWHLATDLFLPVLHGLNPWFKINFSNTGKNFKIPPVRQIAGAVNE